MLTDKRIVVTGGTGSLGQVLVRRLLAGELGMPRQVTVFSRDEAKQDAMRLAYAARSTLHAAQGSPPPPLVRGGGVGDGHGNGNGNGHSNGNGHGVEGEQKTRPYPGDRLKFRIGDLRDLHSVRAVLRNADVVFNAAALKQVPTCEYCPFEAVQTNILGVENIVRCISEDRLPIESVVGISTDKACKPVNVMGMTKAIQERIFVQANAECPGTRFLCVRYGNVLASRGSVIPLFHDQIQRGGPVTVTDREMTRFLMSLGQAVDTIFAALTWASPGEIYVPKVPSARVIDVASVLVGELPIEILVNGIRPGEKIHEILVSEEEAHRTTLQPDYYVIQPMLPDLRAVCKPGKPLEKEFSSADRLMTRAELETLLRRYGLLFKAKFYPRETGWREDHDHSGHTPGDHSLEPDHQPAGSPV
jgi:FlaA1/EpsC-like NDP-sugar epimerase